MYQSMRKFRQLSPSQSSRMRNLSPRTYNHSRTPTKHAINPSPVNKYLPISDTTQLPLTTSTQYNVDFYERHSPSPLKQSMSTYNQQMSGTKKSARRNDIYGSVTFAAMDNSMTQDYKESQYRPSFRSKNKQNISTPVNRSPYKIPQKGNYSYLRKQDQDYKEKALKVVENDQKQNLPLSSYRTPHRDQHQLVEKFELVKQKIDKLSKKTPSRSFFTESLHESRMEVKNSPKLAPHPQTPTSQRLEEAMFEDKCDEGEKYIGMGSCNIHSMSEKIRERLASIISRHG